MPCPAGISGWTPCPRKTSFPLADWFTMDGTQWIIGPGHPCWPAQLTDLSIRSDWAPPLCLWVKGDPRALTSCAKPVGIVGSRDVNEYGRYVAHTVAEQAAVDGHLVVSGGAMGTDAAAHWGALNALHGRKPGCVGRTVAVFAGGLNHMGPARNRTLFERIESQGGALISELCPGTIPEARRFLLRNRIIAALSSTLVVAQARLRSGALNTAGLGLRADARGVCSARRHQSAMQCRLQQNDWRPSGHDSMRRHLHERHLSQAPSADYGTMPRHGGQRTARCQ